jgi:uncharacterized membrane protein YebE (DUF533 family)
MQPKPMKEPTMTNAKSLLDSLFANARDLTSGAGAGDLAQQAKAKWNDQSTLTKGAIAGGLLGVLLSGNARKLVGTGAKVGGAALIGGLAYKAYEDWKAGKKAADIPAPSGQPLALPEPSPAFLPTSDGAVTDLAERLVQAMVAATKADGQVTAEERQRIDAQLRQLGLEAHAQALIAAELDSPLDVGRIAGLARTPEEAAEIYTASLLVVDPNGAAERGYLAMLAARLGLEDALVAHLHARAAQLG